MALASDEAAGVLADEASDAFATGASRELVGGLGSGAAGGLGSAAAYLGADPTDIALTDSTTMGLGLLYTGLDLRADQEILTTEHDFYATHESLAFAAERTGARLRRVPLYRDIENVTEDEIAQA